jgi:glycine/D-amino acid oxidase-like deaminating enzyme
VHIISSQSPIQFDKALPAAVDVVIIGAGIIGITTAWFLAKQGIKVLVCDKGRVAGEQSSRNWGWIRQQGRDEAELPIMMDSLKIWQGLSKEIAKEQGVDIGFRREGSLYCSKSDAELANHDPFLSFSKQDGLESFRLNQKQIQNQLHSTQQQWQTGIYTPGGARAEPSLAVPAIAQACAAPNSGPNYRHDVDIIENCAVRTLSTVN